MSYKNLIVSPEFPNGKEVDYTQAQIDECKAVKPIEDARWQKEKDDRVQAELDRKSGNQKLLDLGLTQAEATALTGYNPEQ